MFFNTENYFAVNFSVFLTAGLTLEAREVICYTGLNIRFVKTA
jgi:hypothetical protein